MGSSKHGYSTLPNIGSDQRLPESKTPHYSLHADNTNYNSAKIPNSHGKQLTCDNHLAAKVLLLQGSVIVAAVAFGGVHFVTCAEDQVGSVRRFCTERFVGLQ